MDADRYAEALFRLAGGASSAYAGQAGRRGSCETQWVVGRVLISLLCGNISFSDGVR
jgi:hypothetical protein